MDKVFVEQKLKEITDKIVKEYQPEKIILFGSWAWGEPGPDSDLDLLIVQESGKPRLERERELRKFLSPTGIALDILVYNPQELEKSINENRNLFIEDIVRNGKILYDKPESTLTVTLPERPLIVLR